MRTTTTIFFLTLLVLVQTPVGQALKFPVLVEHFIKHQKQEGVSLLKFLQDHYTSSHRDADTPEDEQLPFKNNLFYAIGFAIVPGAVNTQLPLPFAIEKKIFFPKIDAPQQHLASIFHPPRV